MKRVRGWRTRTVLWAEQKRKPARTGGPITMNWEEKLAEARKRRAVVLAARKAAEKANASETPPAPRGTGKARVVDMSKEPPQPVQATPTMPQPMPEAPTPEAPTPKAMRQRKKRKFLPTLVLDDAYQLRDTDNPDKVRDPEAEYPPDLREKKPVFRTARTDLPNAAAKGITGLAVAGIALGVLFQEVASNPADVSSPRTAMVLDVEAEVWSEIGTVPSVNIPEDVTLAEAIKPDLGSSILAPDAMKVPVVPFGSGPEFAVTLFDEPVLLASLDAPAGLVLPKPGNAPDAVDTQPAEIVQKRIRVIVPDDVGQGVREAIVARIGDVPKATLDGVAAVDYRISATHVRFYHEADRDTAVSFAEGIGAVARDFTDYNTPETIGYLEVYLKGGDTPASPEPARVEEVGAVQSFAAQPDRDIARVIDEILKN